MSKRAQVAAQRPTKRAPCSDGAVGSANALDVPSCASGPAYRFSWTLREIVNIIRRRS